MTCLTALICLALLLAWPLPVLAAGFPGSEGIPAAPASQAAFETWLQATGRPVCSRVHGYRACYETYRDYQLLVYGTPGQVPGNRYDSTTGLYAMLGFSYDEVKVTNSLFRDDAPGGVTQSTPWKWSELNQGQAAQISWARLSAREKVFIKSAQLTYRGNSYGGMTFSALKLTEASTIVLAPPSWNLGFALYTTHYLSAAKKEVRYATFNGNGAGSVTVGCEIQIRTAPSADGKFVIGPNAETLDILYDVSGRIISFGGLADAADIQSCGAGNNLGWTAGSGTGPWVKTLALHVSRADLAGQPERQYRLQGSAWAVSRMGDVQICENERLITVKAEEKEPPFRVDVAISGSIGYFSGQTTSLGLTLPVSPHRFLAMERLKISLDFNRAPLLAEITFAGQKIRLAGSAGQTHYEASLIIPRLPSTLAWDGRRLASPLQLQVYARDRSGPAEELVHETGDIEITGDVFDITYAQVNL